MSQRDTQVFFWTTLVLVTVTIALVALFSGFHHDQKKFQVMLVTIVLVMLFMYLIGDPVKFILQSIDYATWPPTQERRTPKRGGKQHSRLEYLKVKLNGLKSKLLITEQHRDEFMNNTYRLITKDLWLYGKYFIILFLLILVTRDSLLYYNTAALETLFSQNHTSHYGLNEVVLLNQLFSFMESTLIIDFNPDSKGTEESIGWIHAEQNRLLGVIRLRQVRLQSLHHGLNDAEYTLKNYLPDWVVPVDRQYYTRKYWRIYEPWEPMENTTNNVVERQLFYTGKSAVFRSYPELEGYMSLLARNRQNGDVIIQFLKDHHWYNRYTAALFIEFTLYNADCNIFSICELRMERLPFGMLINYVDVISLRLLESIDQLDFMVLIMLLLYVLVVVQFAKALFLKLWFEPSLIKEFWNRVDLVIFTLNVIILILILIREVLVSFMLNLVESSSKMEYIDFRTPVKLHSMTMILIGFLIALATIRLWKVLQFASVFRMFTFTLYQAWVALFSTAFVIIIFVIAFSIATEIMNGNRTNRFRSFIQSIVTCVCFSFGFTSEISPADLFFGGEIVGVALYALMAFCIVILLMNMFVSIVNDYFTLSKSWRDAHQLRRINYLQFLRVEYNDSITFIKRCPMFSNRYKRRNRSVHQNIAHEMRLQQLEGEKDKIFRSMAASSVETTDSVNDQLNYRLRIEKIYGLAHVFDTQLDILSFLLFEQDEDEDEDDIYTYT